MNSPLNVLLVDDSEDDYIITRDLFSETQGSTVNLEWVASYQAAIERIGQRCHDVYIFDYYMGAHNGLELLEWAVEHGVRAPMILLTGEGKGREIELQALQAGAADYLVKGRTDASLLDHTVRYAFEHARRLEVLRDLTIRDDLTGLYNRREMDRLLKVEIARCQRYGHPLSLVVIDIDDFKVINDTFGHLAGDGVLRSIAQLLVHNLRSPDTLARYGGDELVLILPETPGHRAFLVAERIRRAVETHDFGVSPPTLHTTEHVHSLSPTISLGIASINHDLNSVEDLFQAADRALYKAKRAGHNRTIAFTPTINPTIPLSDDYSIDSTQP